MDQIGSDWIGFYDFLLILAPVPGMLPFKPLHMDIAYMRTDIKHGLTGRGGIDWKKRMTACTPSCLLPEWPDWKKISMTMRVA